MSVFTTVYNYLSAVGAAFTQDIRLAATGGWLDRRRGLGIHVRNRRRVLNRAANPGNSNTNNTIRHLEDPNLVGEEAAARARHARLARETAGDILLRVDRRSDFFLGPTHTESPRTDSTHSGLAHAEPVHAEPALRLTPIETAARAPLHTESSHSQPSRSKRARVDDAEYDQAQPPRPYKKLCRDHATSNAPVGWLRTTSGAAKSVSSIGTKRAHADGVENGQTEPVRAPKKPCRDHTGGGEQPHIPAFDRNKARYIVKLAGRPRSHLAKRKRGQFELSNTGSHEAREAKRLLLQLRGADREATRLKNRVFEVCQGNYFLGEKCQYLQDQLKERNKKTQKKVTFDLPEETASGEPGRSHTPPIRPDAVHRPDHIRHCSL
ncbi:hypothetical protein DL766_003345 [Monosporascus sp. MC13-8B]|uniref:Uncharacterized protein n=1 Tax=Monosporascus cannonballus TaxID=155416 RepID=A0ABY0HK38_9PEZI|nr:hypothetical protein DL763_005652 [Monosporascus cannonballus]RYO95344.1 hypothetical protein DL762_000086 [Monosporascus cannonballus]RYP33648.1 hypothetical protein DL766_003345 [Monosporascus sp. MC13-8B]